MFSSNSAKLIVQSSLVIIILLVWNQVDFIKPSYAFRPSYQRCSSSSSSSFYRSSSCYHNNGILSDSRSATTVAIRRSASLKSEEDSSKSTDTEDDEDSTSSTNNFVRIFFDISINDEEIGRLIFKLTNDPAILPEHRDNLIKLCTEERRGIDPKCSYVGCEFRYSPQFIEGFPQYRWAHILDGRNKNAVGRSNERIVPNPTLLSQCTHSLYGGIYYGLNYDEIVQSSVTDDDDENDNFYGVVLTVPLTGAGRGYTSLSVVRVDESPQEWQQRLLLNSAVLGYLQSGIETLQFMARQKYGPPVITKSGVL